VGWGHSTWQEAVKLAKAANVKKLVIFHHDPLHDDDFMDGIKNDVVSAYPNSLIAWEGLEIDLLAADGLAAAMAPDGLSPDGLAGDVLARMPG
jgi:hypothetical protein